MRVLQTIPRVENCDMEEEGDLTKISYQSLHRLLRTTPYKVPHSPHILPFLVRSLFW